VVGTHKWSILAVLVSAVVYVSNWIVVELLHSEGKWIPGSKLHHEVASMQAAASVLASVFIVIGIRRERSSGFTILAITVATITMAGATV